MKTHDERMATFEKRRARIDAQTRKQRERHHARQAEHRQELRASLNEYAAVKAAYVESKLEMPEDERRAGDVELICPHCRAKGLVTTELVKVKRGVSGGKATGAVLTLGLSLVLTGLSRKQLVTRATCANCHSTWIIN